MPVLYRITSYNVCYTKLLRKKRQKNRFKGWFVAIGALLSSLHMSAQTIDSTNVSLRNCQYPDWFRDAKSGIWSHCGPQAVPRMGDWYAKKMNEEGSTDYKYHLEHYIV